MGWAASTMARVQRHVKNHGIDAAAAPAVAAAAVAAAASAACAVGTASACAAAKTSASVASAHLAGASTAFLRKRPCVSLDVLLLEKPFLKANFENKTYLML